MNNSKNIVFKSKGSDREVDVSVSVYFVDVTHIENSITTLRDKLKDIK